MQKEFLDQKPGELGRLHFFYRRIVTAIEEDDEDELLDAVDGMIFSLHFLQQVMTK